MAQRATEDDAKPVVRVDRRAAGPLRWAPRAIGEEGDLELRLDANWFCSVRLIPEVAATLQMAAYGDAGRALPGAIGPLTIPGDTEVAIAFVSGDAATWKIGLRSEPPRPGSFTFRLAVEECRPGHSQDPRMVQASRAIASAKTIAGEDYAGDARLLADVDFAIATYRRSDRQAELAEALVTAAQIEQGLYRTGARDRMEEALQAALASGDQRVLARVRRSLGLLLLEDLKAREALAMLRDAAETARRAGDRMEEARAQTSLGYATEIAGNIGDAPSIYDRAIALWREEAWRPGLAWALLERSHNAIDRSEERDAIPTLTESRRLFEALGDRIRLAKTIRAFGGLYSKLDDKQRALEEFENARKLLPEEGEDQLKAVLQNSMGQVYYDLGEYRLATDYYKEALRLLEKLGEQISIARTTQQLGRCAFGQGETAVALARYEAALSIYRERSDRRWQSRVLQDIALLRIRNGEPESAVRTAGEALALVEKEDDDYTRADALRTLAITLHQAGSLDEASARYRDALDLAKQHGYRNGEAWTGYHLARLERDRGNLEEARAVLTGASGVVESVRSGIAGNELRATYFASMRDYFELFVDVLMRLDAVQPGRGFAAEAFAAHERGKARMLLDSLQEARVEFREGVNPQLLAREKEIRRRLDRLAEDEAIAGDPAARQHAATELREAVAEYEQVQALIRTESPRYAALLLAKPVSLSDVQRSLLDDETVLLEYAVGETRSYLWAVTPEEMYTFPLPGRGELNRMVAAFRATITARETRQGESVRDRRLRIRAAGEAYPREAVELTRQLLAPVSGLVRGKRLAIVGDGSLNYLPFAALCSPAVAPAEPMRPLIVDHELVLMPSASSVLELRRGDAAGHVPGKLLAIVADPVTEPDDPRMPATGRPTGALSGGVRSDKTGMARAGGTRFARLPSSNIEAQAIAALAADDGVQVWTGFDANRHNVMDIGLAGYRFVHFATHSVLHEEHPELSGIVLSGFDASGREIAGTGFLRLHDLYNLRLPAGMVVLSSCESQLGAEIRGEGLVGVVRGFLYAGSRRVVASLWKVDDVGTKELMFRLYRNIIDKGQPPSAALRHAQVELWEDGDWRSPYYWAAFVLQGEWK